jgi:hypothetical protein
LILIEFHEGQGLGNQLWLYAAGKATADFLNCDLIIDNPKLFKGIEFLTIEYNSSVLIDKKFKASFAIYNEPFFYDETLKAFITFYDKNILSIKINTILRGIFQSENYLIGHQNNICNIIKLKKTVCPPKALTFLDSRTCVINLRGGEYKKFKNLILPLDYWLNAINYMKKYNNVNKFIVVTDDKYYAKALFPDLEVISGSVATCFQYLTFAKNVIVSNSSFAYFPLAINKYKPFVIAPAFWSRFNNPKNLWIAPCNLYQKWYWMDAMGKLSKYSHFENTAFRTWKYYCKNFPLQNEWKFDEANFFNTWKIIIKRYIKKRLSFLLPRLIG